MLCFANFASLFASLDLSCFLCNQAIHGQGVERHMLGLKMVAIEDLTSLPEIFMDTSYAVSSHFNLYTSQVCGCSRPFTHCS